MRSIITILSLAFCGLSSIKALPFEVVNRSVINSRGYNDNTQSLPAATFARSTYLAQASANTLDHFCTNYVNTCGNLALDNQAWVASCNYTVMTTDQYQFYYKDCRGRTPKYHEKCGKWATLGEDNCWKNPCDNEAGSSTSSSNNYNQFNQGLPSTKREEPQPFGTNLFARKSNEEEAAVWEKRCDSGVCESNNSPWWGNTNSGYVEYPTGHCKQHCNAKDIHRIPNDKCKEVHYKHHFKFYLQVKAFCFIEREQKSDDCARSHGGMPYDFKTLQS